MRDEKTPRIGMRDRIQGCHGQRRPSRSRRGIPCPCVHARQGVFKKCPDKSVRATDDEKSRCVSVARTLLSALPCATRWLFQHSRQGGAARAGGFTEGRGNPLVRGTIHRQLTSVSGARCHWSSDQCSLQAAPPTQLSRLRTRTRQHMTRSYGRSQSRPERGGARWPE
jgi:hypothetical protein